MRIRQLHYFYALGRYLNYKLAADALFITQSVLSQQIVDLEFELSVPLFLRDRKTLELSPAGAELMRSLPDLFKLIDQTFSVVHNADSETAANEILRIGFEKPILDTDIAGFIRSIQSLEPDTKCMVTQYSFQRLSDAMKNRQVDIGFFMMPCADLPQNLSFQLVSCDTLALVFRKELLNLSADSIREAIAGKSIFYFEKNSGGTPQVFRMCHMLNIVPELHFCDEIDEIMCNVESGLGVSILPRKYVDSSSFSDNLLVVDLSGFDESGLCTVAAFDPEACSPAALRFLRLLPQNVSDCTSCFNTTCHLHHKNMK